MAYAAHLSLTWEALHCQYTQLRQKILVQADRSLSYCSAAQAFQQFQVLLQRFLENEPFEPGSRAEIYARARLAMPKLLQVPSFQGGGREDSGLLLYGLISAILVDLELFNARSQGWSWRARSAATRILLCSPWTS